MRRQTVRALLALLTVHKAKDSSIRQLIRARRYQEASRALPPGQSKDRARLALARRGPLIDILTTARAPRIGLLRKEARLQLQRMYPGDKWYPAIPFSYGVEDPSQHSYRALTAKLAQFKLTRASWLAMALLRAFPQADTVTATRTDLLASLIFRAKGTDALATARGIVANASGGFAKDQASRIANRIAVSQAPGGALSVVTSRGARAAAKRVHGWAEATARPWPITPQDLATLASRSTYRVTDKVLDIAAMAENLAAGHAVWVGVLADDGSARCHSVLAAETVTRTALLDGGRCLDLDSLTQLSIWGGRMVVLHMDATTTFGQARPTEFSQIPCPRTPHGDVDASPFALEQLKAAVAKYPADALASFNYALALKVALEGGGAPGYDENAYSEHLAVTAARFPKLLWPQVWNTQVSQDNGGLVPGALLNSGLRHTLPNKQFTTAADHLVFTAEADSRLSDHLVTNPLALESLNSSLMAAARRSDGHSYDAHLDLLQRMNPQNPHLPHLQQLREVVWRGASGARDAIANGPFDPQDPQLITNRVALAATSADVATLTALVNQSTEHRLEDIMRQARIIAALHAGGVKDFAAACSASVKTSGFNTTVAEALLTRSRTLDPADYGKVVEALAPAISSGGSGFHNLVGDLTFRAPDLAAAMIRKRLSLHQDDSDAQYRLALNLIHRALRYGGHSARDLAREARDLLKDVLQSNAHMMNANLVEAAAWLPEDPERTHQILTTIERVDTPLLGMVLAIEVQERQGNTSTVEELMARAANAELIGSGLGRVASLGLYDTANKIIARADIKLLGAGAWMWLSVGGELPTLPPLPLPIEPAVPTEAIWKVIETGDLATASALINHKWHPMAMLDLSDGAARSAMLSALASLRGDKTALNALAATSKHPEVARALSLTSRQGVAA